MTPIISRPPQPVAGSLKFAVILAALLLGLSYAGRAQILEVGYSPGSVIGWGNLPETRKLDVSLLLKTQTAPRIAFTPGVRYSYLDSRSMAMDEKGDPVRGSFHVIFLMPASFEARFGRWAVLNRAGMGFSSPSFPNKNGLRLNFLLELGLRYRLTDHLSVSGRYSHMSNAAWGQINPGLDNVVLSTGFHF